MLIDPAVYILIVEDQEGFKQLLQLMLKELGLHHIQIARGYQEAWQFFQGRKPDLCLIDIDLGEGEKDGIALAEKIRAVAPTLPLIYLTSDYTEECYQRCRHTLPSSFMNKELSRLKLYQAIELALIHQPATVVKSVESAPVTPVSIPYLHHEQFFFKVGDVYKNFAIADIDFFFSKGKMTYAKINKRNFPTNVQLKTLEEELFPRFLRIHKTFLVNLSHIDSIHLKENKVEIAGELLPIGYVYRKEFMEQLKLLK
jgi:DNA-binding LytR/AlgR family response regulator